MIGSTREEALAQALPLPLSDRLQLVERAVASAGQDISNVAPDELRSEEHWGKHLVRLIEEPDFTDWTDIDAEDPVEGVQHARQDQADRLGLDQGSDE